MVLRLVRSEPEWLHNYHLGQEEAVLSHVCRDHRSRFRPLEIRQKLMCSGSAAVGARETVRSTSWAQARVRVGEEKGVAEYCDRLEGFELQRPCCRCC